jgi:hypothetical protein
MSWTDPTPLSHVGREPCAGMLRNGEPCHRYAQRGSIFCIGHKRCEAVYGLDAALQGKYPKHGLRDPHRASDEPTAVFEPIYDTHARS